MKRAMISAVLNLCEGNGKRRYSKDRRRFFEISLGSISEVMACLELSKVFGLIKPNEADTLKSHLKLSYVRINALP